MIDDIKKTKGMWIPLGLGGVNLRKPQQPLLEAAPAVLLNSPSLNRPIFDDMIQKSSKGFFKKTGPTSTWVPDVMYTKKPAASPHWTQRQLYIYCTTLGICKPCPPRFQQEPVMCGSLVSCVSDAASRPYWFSKFWIAWMARRTIVWISLILWVVQGTVAQQHRTWFLRLVIPVTHTFAITKALMNLFTININKQ